mmetsp:Transcript_55690/g.172791  ORF Transcript_55690/g.172791 Transcript_55690/m.172791 type:complete len:91 (+) Transcript_55690:557-829(+)
MATGAALASGLWPSTATGAALAAAPPPPVWPQSTSTVQRPTPKAVSRPHSYDHKEHPAKHCHMEMGGCQVKRHVLGTAPLPVGGFGSYRG